MAYESGSGSVAAVAIVVLVLIGLGAGYLIFAQTVDRGAVPDLEVEVPAAPDIDLVPERAPEPAPANP